MNSFFIVVFFFIVSFFLKLSTLPFALDFCQQKYRRAKR